MELPITPVPIQPMRTRPGSSCGAVDDAVDEAEELREEEEEEEDMVERRVRDGELREVR